MLFNYNTLLVELAPETKSVKVLFKNEQLNIETLFELESLFAWLTSHLEVTSVLLSSQGEYFGKGFDKEELKLMSEEKLIKYMGRFQKLIQAMVALPQTIICDLKNGAEDLSVEFALGTDIRLINHDGKLHFNFLENGWVPNAGGVSLLSELVGKSHARSWLLSGAKVSSQKLSQSGFVLGTTQEVGINELLESIAKQSPIARIQTKRALFDTVHKQFDETIHFDTSCALVSLKTEDWKKDQEQENFTSARDFRQNLNAPDKYL